jgi:lipopolysaccharide heptosyltransferase II
MIEIVDRTATAARAPHWQNVRRLLAVRLDNMGDVLMTTPALAAIHDSLPGVQITLLTSPAGAAVAPHLPMLDAVWSFTAPWVQHETDPPDSARPGRDEVALVGRLADGGFDAAVIFTVCTQSALPSALLCRMAGIGLRAAYCRENPYQLLTDWLPEIDRVVPGATQEEQQHLARHEVLRQLALVAALGLHTVDDRLRFAVLEDDRQSLARKLRAAGIAAGTPYAVVQPGASAESRRWPAGYFGAAAHDIAAGGCAVVFSGNSAETALVEQALEVMALPAVSLAGRLSLGELGALIEGARVLVANNSGAAHLGAALGTPVVDLYALTNPQHTPWRVESRVLNHDVPCRWCLKSVCPQLHHDCLRQVQPQQVASAALELMRRPAAAARETEP